MLSKPQKDGLWRDAVALSKYARMPVRSIAAKLNVSKTFVQFAVSLARKWLPLKDAPRTGRPRKTSRRDDARMIRSCKKGPMLSAREVHSASGVPKVLHKATVCRRLRAGGLRSHRCAKVSALTANHLKARLAFARRYKSFDFRSVVFSDEKRFTLAKDGASLCWRLKDTRYLRQNVRSRQKFGSGGLMVLMPLPPMVWGHCCAWIRW